MVSDGFRELLRGSKRLSADPRTVTLLLETAERHRNHSGVVNAVAFVIAAFAVDLVRTSTSHCALVLAFVQCGV
jgi:hypothetical protein